MLCTKRTPWALLLVFFVVACVGTDQRGAESRGTQSALVDSAPAPPRPIDITELPALIPAASVGYLPGGPSVSATGELQYGMPIEVPPGRAGMQPRLALTYASRSGNGLAGVGFSISAGSEIRRCPRTIATEGGFDGIDFDATDAYCLDGRKLLARGRLGTSGTEYRTEEDIFARVVGYGPAGAPTSFRVWLEDGRIRSYAPVWAWRSTISAIGALDHEQVLVSWRLSTEQDRAGNALRYEYAQISSPLDPYHNESRLQRIAYTEKIDALTGDTLETPQRSVEFIYEPRPDTIVAYEAGVRTVMSGRLAMIQMVAPTLSDEKKSGIASLPVWHYRLDYTESDGSGRSLLQSVERCGALGGCQWKRVFNWKQSPRPSFESIKETIGDVPVAMHVFDVDDNGRDDILYKLFVPPSFPSVDESTYTLMLHAGGMGGAPLQSAVIDLDPAQSAFHHIELGASRPLDPNGDGKVGLWASQWKTPCAQRLFRWDVVNATLTPKNAPGEITCTSETQGPPEVDFVDLDGDGRLDMIRREGSDSSSQGTWGVRMNQSGQYGAAQSVGAAVAGCSKVGADIDGDGRGELLVGLGTCDQASAIRVNDAGALEAAQVKAVGALGLELVRADQPLVMGDLNGDGLAEAMWFGSWGELRWNIGTGFAAREPIPDVALQALLAEVDPIQRSVLVADVDSDGRDDLLVFSRATAHRGTFAFLSRGNGTFHMLDVGIDPRGMPRLGDLNGDGLTDLVLAGTNAVDAYNFERLIQKPGETDVIEAVEDEVYAGPVPRVQVEYGRELSGDVGATVCKVPQRCGRRGLPVVRKLSGGDTNGTHLYSYEDPRYDRHGRGFLGFGTVREWIPERPSETIITYDHATRWGTSYPYALRPKSIRQVVPILEDGAGSPTSARARVTETTYTYDVRALNPSFFVYPTGLVSKEWEESAAQIDWTESASIHVTGLAGPGETPLRKRTAIYTFDNYGNLTHESVTTVGGDKREVSRVYDYSRVNDWLTSLLVSQDVAEGPANASLPAPQHTEFSYDARGYLKTTSIEPQSIDPDLRETIEATIDSDGLLRAVTKTAPNEPFARRTHYEYADLTGERIYPSQVWNDLGHAVWTAYHPAYGVALLSMDGNGARSITAYDDLGRVAWTQNDGGARVSYAYEATTFNGITTGIAARVGDNASGTYLDKSILYFNRKGLVPEERHLGFDGQWIVTTRSYDLFERLKSETRPGFGQPGIGSTLLRYDSLDRLVEQKEPDGTKSTFVHTFLTQETTDPAGHKTRIERDAEGRVIKSTSYVAGPNASVQALTTQYQYGVFGRLEKVLDPQNNATVTEYDARGRRYRLIDPDTGESKFSYNGYGELKDTVDALGKTTIYHRDVLGRPTQIESADGLTEMTWDTSPHGLGKLAWTKSPDGTEQRFFYDAFGRPTISSWGIDGDKYQVEVGYDSAGRPAALRYPEVSGQPRFTVAYAYNDAGHLEQLDELTTQNGTSQTKPLWMVKARNADGALLAGTYGNGITRTQSYLDPMGRLHGVQATRGGAAALFSLEYAYDKDGKVESRHDGASPTPRSEYFTYDEVERLRTWSLTLGKTVQTTTTTEYQYDPLGNLTSVLAGGTTTALNAYGVVANGTLTKPHALRLHNQESYLYDARGRLRDGGGRSITYTAFDLPRTIEMGGEKTAFWYDAAGSRVKKAGPSGTTISISDLYERRDGPDGITHVFYVHGPDGPVAQVIHHAATQQTETQYFVTDSLGSVGLVTSESGAELERAYFEPFGQRIQANGAPLGAGPNETRVGFTGHRHDDELGLIDMRGRIYDPKLRRFLTPDPFVAMPLFGQSYNRYSYVLNSPLNLVDPTGYMPNGFTPVPTKIIGWDTTVCAGIGGGCLPAPIVVPIFDPPAELPENAPHMPGARLGPSTPPPDVSDGRGYRDGISGGGGRGGGSCGQERTGSGVVFGNGLGPGGLGGAGVGVGRSEMPDGDFLNLRRFEYTLFFAREFWYDLDVARLAWSTGDTWQAVEYFARALTDIAAGGLVYSVESGAVSRKIGGAISAASTAANMAPKGTAPKGGTYQLKDPATQKVVRNGRTNDLARREREHARNPDTEKLAFDVKHRTDDYKEQRGLEQMQIEAQRGSMDKIRGIDPRSPRRQEYMDAAEQFLKEKGQ